MTEDEAKAVLEQPNTRTATGARDRAMLLCLYRGGLRVGEVVGLTKRHLQADAGKHGKLVFAG
ncbi:MAG: tyrosine-type recombinase/integrase, partial [Gemmatimonadetes bacterium]|nr:tyrosine-type recombinase/integrase [Gemmatimonadota bacterium]